MQCEMIFGSDWGCDLINNRQSLILYLLAYLLIPYLFRKQHNVDLLSTEAKYVITALVIADDVKKGI